MSATARLSADAPPRPFLRQRLGSLLAIAPLGVWTFIHLWNNLAALDAGTDGGAAWEKSVTEYPHPAAQLVTAIVVLLPLVLHTVWGVGRLLTTRPNNVRYRFFGNLKYLLQRLSAIGILLFLGAHIWLASLQPRLQQGHAETFSGIAHEMRWHLPTLIVYVLGTLGVAYHLGNGIQTFAMGWGIATTRIGLRRVSWLSWIVFVLALAMSWGVIYALWLHAPPK